MIKVDDIIVVIEHFPDGTPRINFDCKNVHGYIYDNCHYIDIKWKYENDSELMYLIMIVKHLRESFINNTMFNLYLDYIPNARMDRVHNDYEVFTLKYFCDVINDLDFSGVIVLDAHSNVAPALLNHCYNNSPKGIIQNVISEIENTESELILYFPDEGSSKRYANMFPRYKYCYGEKVRDWDTGKIKGIDVRMNNIDTLENKTILMIDDIISYGGSMYYSALKLSDLGCSNIYAYSTHTEDSVLDKDKGTLIKAIDDGIVKELYTTDSLYKGYNPHIKVMTLKGIKL